MSSVEMNFTVDVDLDDVFSEDKAISYAAEHFLEEIMEQAGKNDCMEVVRSNGWDCITKDDAQYIADGLQRGTTLDAVDFIMQIVRSHGGDEFKKQLGNAIFEENVEHNELIEMVKNLGLKVFKEM